MAIGAGNAVATFTATCTACKQSPADLEHEGQVAATSAACDEALLRQAFAMLAITCGNTPALRSWMLQWCDVSSLKKVLEWRKCLSGSINS